MSGLRERTAILSEVLSTGAYEGLQHQFPTNDVAIRTWRIRRRARPPLKGM